MPQLARESIKSSNLHSDPSPMFPNGIPIRQRTPTNNRQKRKPTALSSNQWFWGQSETMKELRCTVERSDFQSPHILIIGETGTGKELVARKIHAQRAANLLLEDEEAPFVAINSGAIPEALAESILFGHERGAFTSARDRQYGKFEMAKRGSLFLDEVQCLSLSTQVKLLRVLQNNEFERLGSRSVQPIECQIIAATNVPLELLVKRQLFRKDLYYRLNVSPIYLPALRQRKEDLPILIKGLLQKLGQSRHLNAEDLSPEAFEMLLDYSWPGNIRELEHALLYAATRSTNSLIEASNLPGSITGRLSQYLNAGSWDLPPIELASL